VNVQRLIGSLVEQVAMMLPAGMRFVLVGLRQKKRKEKPNAK
jgi:hypothetical protein